MAKRELGKCSVCQYYPVAFDAASCPKCGARNKARKLVDRFVGRSMVLGTVIGSISLAVSYWVNAKPDEELGLLTKVLIGAFVGIFPGLFFGFIFGLVVGLVAWMTSKMTGWPSERPKGGIIVPKDADETN